jgi:hypothetical protein
MAFRVLFFSFEGGAPRDNKEECDSKGEDYLDFEFYFPLLYLVSNAMGEHHQTYNCTLAKQEKNGKYLARTL